MKNLTDREKQLIIESLLFSSSSDVCAEWNEKTQNELIDIAKKIQGETLIKLNTIYLFGKIFENSYSKNIQKNFNIERRK